MRKRSSYEVLMSCIAGLSVLYALYLCIESFFYGSSSLYTVKYLTVYSKFSADSTPLLFFIVQIIFSVIFFSYYFKVKGWAKLVFAMLGVASLMIPATIRTLLYFGILDFGMMIALLKVAVLEVVILILYFADKHTPREESSS